MSHSYTRKSDEGAAALEFALVLPIMVLLIFGAIQFSLIFTQWQRMEHAVREGARWASLQHSVADVQSVVQNAAGPDFTFSSINVSAGAPIPPGIAVTVDAVATVDVFTPGLEAIIGSPQVTLTAQATQMAE